MAVPINQTVHFTNDGDKDRVVDLIEEISPNIDFDLIYIMGVSIICFDDTTEPFYRKVKITNRDSKKLKEYKAKQYIPDNKKDLLQNHPGKAGEILTQVDIPLNGFQAYISDNRLWFPVPPKTTVTLLITYMEDNGSE